MPTLILGLLFTDPVCSHDVDTGNNAAGTIQLTQAEKAWLAEHPTITIAGPRSFPPFHFYETDKFQGMSADYTTQAAAAIGLKLRSFANLAWPQVLERARQGEIDLIPCIAKTAERKTFLDFSVPYLTFPPGYCHP